MSRALLALGAWLLSSVGPNVSTNAGLKIVTVRRFAQGPALKTTEYVRSDRRRIEYQSMFGRQAQPSEPIQYEYGPRTAMIIRCDLERQFLVNLDAREYETGAVPEYRLSKIREMMRQNAAVLPPRAPGLPTILIETTTTDTRERKEIFGLTARRVVTRRTEMALTDGDRSNPQEYVTDGWYVDLDRAISWDRSWQSSSGHFYSYGTIVNGPRATSLPTPVPTPIFKDIGTPERGFPIELRTTSRTRIRLSDGTTRELVDEWSMAVTELSAGPVESALFEVPAGFRHTNRLDRVILSEIARAWEQLRAAIRKRPPV
jgi:hypothetical protein